ncbi:hypothetical protein GGI03_001450 [Coemansia sp. RSA 2337]|nr:hypothetical protein H4S03_006052 [Coemansia sp. S3946]KAJ2052642.1 hypothetical protein H4S04_001212 [Coemansia sp. S16]KAJ2110128.1 hypothetical protein IW146_006041 [Coemansia sp. RSA 922]KAJ2467636.1 hypothetical protein GGI03_001450 [Coemansia sp. RSA 2337]
MMFPNTVVEDHRVAAAQAMGIDLDRRSTADLAIVTTISVVYFIDFLAVIFMLWNRRYPPIKAKSPILMACLFLSSALWFVGDVQMNGHVTLANTVLTNCRGLGFWVRILLGICGVCAVFALRSFALYHVFCLNLPYRGMRVYLPIIVYSVCIIIYGIVALVLKSTATLYYIDALDLCSSAVPFKASVFAFVWITLAFVAFNYWRIRHIKSSFNESREMAGACLLIFATMLFMTLVQFLHPRFPLSLAYRITSTVLSHLCTNTIWWGTMAVPLWNCMFHRKAYLDKWVDKLRKDGLHREYHVDSSSFIRGEFTPADIAMSEAVVAKQTLMYKSSDNYGFFYANEGGATRTFINTGDDDVYIGQGAIVEEDAHGRTISWLHSRNSKDAGFGNDRHLL